MVLLGQSEHTTLNYGNKPAEARDVTRLDLKAGGAFQRPSRFAGPRDCFEDHGPTTLILALGPSQQSMLNFCFERIPLTGASVFANPIRAGGLTPNYNLIL